MMVVGHTTQRFGGLLIDVYNKIKSKDFEHTIYGEKVDYYMLFDNMICVYQALVSYGQAISSNSKLINIAKKFGFHIMELSLPENSVLIIDPDSYCMEDPDYFEQMRLAEEEK